MENFIFCAVKHYFHLRRYTKKFLKVSVFGEISKLNVKIKKNCEENTRGGFILVQGRYSEQLAYNFGKRRSLKQECFSEKFFARINL